MNIVSIIIVWFIASAILLLICVVNNQDAFNDFPDHIYLGHIILFTLTLPLTLMVLIVYVIIKLCMIQIK